MSEPRKQYLAVKDFYSLMIRAQKYKMAYRAADAAEALCGPFGMCMDDERERNRFGFRQRIQHCNERNDV